MSESDTMFDERDRCTTHALYQSKLWQRDHGQHPQNANPNGPTLEGIAQCIGRPFGGGGAEAQRWGHRQEEWSKEFVEKVQSIIDETPRWCGDPLVQSGGQ